MEAGLRRSNNTRVPHCPLRNDSPSRPPPGAALTTTPSRLGRAGSGRGGKRAGGGACRDSPYEGSAGSCLPLARPLTRRRSAAQHGSAMAAAAEEAAGSGGGGSPSSARRRLRIISGHLRSSPRAPEREALSLSPCKAQGGSTGPASGSIPRKRWVRAGVPIGRWAPCLAQEGRLCRAGLPPGVPAAGAGRD